MQGVEHRLGLPAPDVPALRGIELPDLALDVVDLRTQLFQMAMPATPAAASSGAIDSPSSCSTSMPATSVITTLKT